MRKKYLILLLVLSISCISFGQEKTKNNIIVFDITGSMIGRPPNSSNKDIWKPSKKLLEDQINSFISSAKDFEREEKITLYLFGDEVQNYGTFSTGEGKSLTSKITNIIDTIFHTEKHKKYTCIYKSLDKVINELDSKYHNTVFLFTDGSDSGQTTCNNTISAEEVSNIWAKNSSPDEFLYVFKLKEFRISDDLKGPTIEIIHKALQKRKVTIEPKNSDINISKKNLKTSQQFRVIGAGESYLSDLSDDIFLKVNKIKLRNNDITEDFYTNIDNRNTTNFKLNNSVQNFQITPYDTLENIKEGIYTGIMKYSFEGNERIKTFSVRNNIFLTVEIINPVINISFDNTKDKPKAIVEFID